MPIRPIFPANMMLEIDNTLKSHEGDVLPVYAEAEKLRQRWLHLNIALEDIVDVLVEENRKYSTAVLFNPEEAKNALLGIPADKPDTHVNGCQKEIARQLSLADLACGTSK